MANRSTTEILYGWLSGQDVPSGQDFTVFCTQAHNVVEEYVEPFTDYSENTYVSIETFLACHYVTSFKHRQTKYTSQAGASDTFTDSMTFLDMAKSFDPEGTIPVDKRTLTFATYGNYEDFEL